MPHSSRSLLEETAKVLGMDVDSVLRQFGHFFVYYNKELVSTQVFFFYGQVTHCDYLFYGYTPPVSTPYA
jgi:hypothetical protein